MKNLLTFALTCSTVFTFAQVQINKPIQLTGGTGERVITNLELPVNGPDAANKDYVDAAVAAAGGGSTKPQEVSAESSSAMVFSDAVQYCETSTEGGNNDWRLPTAGELAYFAGISSSTNYVWTLSLADGKENPVNQNYVSMRLDNGKWRNAGEVTGLLLGNVVTGNTTSTTFVSVASLTALSSGSVLIPTHIKITGYRSSTSPCCASSKARLKFNFADGSSSYSSEYNLSTSNTTVLDMQSIPLISSVTPISSIDLELQAQHAAATTYSTLTVSGYEIAMTQQDGTGLYVRCVR